MSELWVCSHAAHHRDSTVERPARVEGGKVRSADDGREEFLPQEAVRGENTASEQTEPWEAFRVVDGSSMDPVVEGEEFCDGWGYHIRQE